MIAVGNLGDVWTDIFIASEAEFKYDFEGYFGDAWELVMVGAEKPFAAHLYWDGYFSVREIKPASGMHLVGLSGLKHRFSIVAG